MSSPTQKKQALVEQIAACLKYLFRYGGLAGILYAWYLIMTSADEYVVSALMIRYIESMPISQGTAYLIGLVGVLFGLSQRRLFKRRVTHLSDRVHALEKQIESAAMEQESRHA